MTQLEQHGDPLRWYIVRTKPQQEQRAESNLRAWQVETFAPVLRKRSPSRHHQRPAYRINPLFPSYIFARFNAHALLHKIRFTRGIQNVVGFGDGPTPVEDGIVEAIKMRVGDDGFIRMHEELKTGDKVVITSGPLEGFNGIFGGKVGAEERVRILLTTVCYQAHVEIDRDLVKRIR